MKTLLALLISMALIPSAQADATHKSKKKHHIQRSGQHTTVYRQGTIKDLLKPGTVVALSHGDLVKGSNNRLCQIENGGSLYILKANPQNMSAKYSPPRNHDGFGSCAAGSVVKLTMQKAVFLTGGDLPPKNITKFSRTSYRN